MLLTEAGDPQLEGAAVESDTLRRFTAGDGDPAEPVEWFGENRRVGPEALFGAREERLAAPLRGREVALLGA